MIDLGLEYTSHSPSSHVAGDLGSLFDIFSLISSVGSTVIPALDEQLRHHDLGTTYCCSLLHQSARWEEFQGSKPHLIADPFTTARHQSSAPVFVRFISSALGRGFGLRFGVLE